MSRRIQTGFKFGGMEGIGEQRSWQHCPDRSVTQYLPVHRCFYMASAHLKEMEVLPSTCQLPGPKFPCIWGRAQQEHLLNHTTLRKALKISEQGGDGAGRGGHTIKCLTNSICFTSQTCFIPVFTS